MFPGACVQPGGGGSLVLAPRGYLGGRTPGQAEGPQVRLQVRYSRQHILGAAHQQRRHYHRLQARARTGKFGNYIKDAETQAYIM